MHRMSFRYGALLFVQTLCALLILYHIQAIFRVLLDNIGIPQPMPAGILARVILAAVIGQACYWIRLCTMPVPNAHYSIVLGHLFAFASKLLFVFGGALFSLYFLRHLPAMDPAVLDLDFAWRIICLIAVLFVLYCYTLELERLGTALQAPRETSGAEDASGRGRTSP